MLVGVVVIAHTVSAQGRFGGAPTPRTGTRPHSQTATPPPPPPPTTTTSGIAQLPPMQGIAQLPSSAGTPDLFLAGPRTYSPRLNRGNRSSRLLDPFGYATGGYAGVSDSGPATDRRAEVDTPDQYGYLRLNVLPYTAQVFIDGFYVSSVDTFSGGGPARALPAGPHRVEIRADGYDTATFDVRIEPNEMTTYRRELGRAEEPKQARAAAPANPKTFYVIPKCYAGDRSRPRTNCRRDAASRISGPSHRRSASRERPADRRHTEAQRVPPCVVLLATRYEVYFFSQPTVSGQAC
jgi:hypothetical protein